MTTRIAPITKALAENAQLRANLAETRRELDGIIAYMNCDKFSGPGNGHVAVEDIILRVREIEQAMLWRENASEFTGLACSLSEPWTEPAVVEDPYPEASTHCRACNDELRYWFVIRTGYCSRHWTDRAVA